MLWTTSRRSTYITLQARECSSWYLFCAVLFIWKLQFMREQCLFTPISSLLTRRQEREEGCGSEGSEEEEICMHYRECVAGSANKQGAGERHTQRTCDVPFYCHDTGLMLLVNWRSHIAPSREYKTTSTCIITTSTQLFSSATLQWKQNQEWIMLIQHLILKGKLNVAPALWLSSYFTPYFIN